MIEITCHIERTLNYTFLDQRIVNLIRQTKRRQKKGRTVQKEKEKEKNKMSS